MPGKEPDGKRASAGDRRPKNKLCTGGSRKTTTPNQERQVMIEVSDAVRSTFDTKAKAVLAECQKAVPTANFNQDMNAIASLNTLVALGIVVPKEKVGQVLELCKLAGNASANRQRLESKKTAAQGKVAESYMKMVEAK